MQDIHAQLMREKEEPREGFSPIPIFYFSLLQHYVSGVVFILLNTTRISLGCL